MEFRVGIGFDIHRFVEGRLLKLGGVVIPWPLGLEGHSDADVLLHAVADALLGAAGLGDIGTHFPDTDERFKDMDSAVLVEKVVAMLEREKIDIIWLDAIVMAEQPRILPHVDAIREKIGALLKISPSSVSVKGKTSEGLGWVGRNEGIAAQAAVTVKVSHDEKK
jgi:2-C-methyl-D-erythritol 2,4-cyclodiphosphate synthase